MSSLDVKLLGIIVELYRTRSVSQTAENLHLNQPAVSMSLARLRRHFNDPLFVHTQHGMQPTPHASHIIAGLKDAHELIRTALAYHETFVPGTAARTFRIAGTDVGQAVVLPTLMNRLRAVAPSVIVEYTNFTEQSHAQLAAGDLDLGLGFIPPLDGGFHRQTLFTERFVCVVRHGHPRIKRRLTLEDFEREFHLVVTTSATGHSFLEKTLESLKIQRKVGLRVPNFIGLATLITSTDLLVMVPERFAKVMARLVRAQVFPPPMKVPSYEVTQYWHARSDKEPANRWLRSLIVELFQER